MGSSPLPLAFHVDGLRELSLALLDDVALRLFAASYGPIIGEWPYNHLESILGICITMLYTTLKSLR